MTYQQKTIIEETLQDWPLLSFGENILEKMSGGGGGGGEVMAIIEDDQQLYDWGIENR